MLHLAKPRLDKIRRDIGNALSRELGQPEFLASREGLRITSTPPGFAHDRSKIGLGIGDGVFDAAMRALERWQNFDLGWVDVANPEVQIEPGQVVAVRVHSLGLWCLNLSQIVDVIREPRVFGFIYKTTTHHIEEGEERFLLSLDPHSGLVSYDLEAVSKPRALLPRIGFPVTRAFQRKFVRDSQRHMRELATGKV